MPLGIGGEQPAGGLDRHPFADAGDDVVQRAIAGRSVERVVGREQRNADPLRQSLEPRQPAAVAALPRHGRAEPHRSGPRLGQAAQQEFLALVGQ